MERDNSNIARCLLQYSEPSSNDSSTGISKKLEINVVLKSGITKAYRLPCLELDQAYESSFGNENFPNHISCEAKVLKSYMEHMSTKAEEFEMKASESGVSLTSYTIGVSNEAQILKHPLSTRITVGLQEFLTAKLQIGLAIAIRLKELRIMVSFADSLQSRASLTFMFNKPETPMIVEIRGITCTGSMQCFFTFMTQGRYDDGQGPNAERPFLVKEARHRDEGDGYLIPVPPIISVDGDTNNIEREDHISRKNIIVEEDSVRWDNDMEIDVIPQASRAANYKDGGSYEKQHNSSGMDQDLVDEEQERDLDLQLASFADELEKRAVGPTQNVSQAKGLFD